MWFVVALCLAIPFGIGIFYVAAVYAGPFGLLAAFVLAAGVLWTSTNLLREHYKLRDLVRPKPPDDKSDNDD